MWLCHHQPIGQRLHYSIVDRWLGRNQIWNQMWNQIWKHCISCTFIAVADKSASASTLIVWSTTMNSKSGQLWTVAFYHQPSLVSDIIFLTNHRSSIIWIFILNFTNKRSPGYRREKRILVAVSWLGVLDTWAALHQQCFHIWFRPNHLSTIE